MKATYKQVTKARAVAEVSALAREIFVQHYTRLTPRVAAALAEQYQSEDATADALHGGACNYFLIYQGSEAVGYFALDLSTPGAVCIARLFLLEKARGQGIGRGVAAYAQKLAEGDGRTRLYLKTWAKDLKAADVCKRCRFKNSGSAPAELLPGVTLELTLWEKYWR